jgi:aminoglycoside 3-N-acetyltransferase I
VFQEDCHELSDAYVDGLLKRDEFWALAAVSGEHVVGGLTAHTLPMTRTGVPEVFLYDLAVRTDRQRRGIGRQLVRHLREAAAEVGIGELFVPVDVAHEHARHFYRALGGAEAPVAFFTFSGSPS